MVYDPKEYTWWEEMLAAKSDTTGQMKPPPIYNDMPMTGTYILRPSKKEAPKAVFFWYSKNSGELITSIDSQKVKYGLSIWRNCAEHPLDRDVYDSVIGGAPWPEEIRLESGDSTMKPTIGHNSGDVDQDRASMKGNIDEWIDRIKKAAKLGTPATQADADAIADLGTKLNDLLIEAEAKRMAITNPLYKIYKDANAAWDWILPSKTYVANAKALARAYIDAENKRRKDEADAINKAAAETAQKAAAEEAAKRGPAEQEAAPPPVTVAMVQAVPVRAGTRKTVVSAKRKVVVFENFAEAAAYFCTMDPVPPGIMDAVKFSALKVLNAGVAVPGAKLETETFGR